MYTRDGHGLQLQGGGIGGVKMADFWQKPQGGIVGGKMAEKNGCRKWRENTEMAVFDRISIV